MGRSVSYLSNAQRVSYFEWPMYEDEYGNEIYDEADFVIENIQQGIISDFPDFSTADKWDGREDHIILQGYGTEIAISEYCGLCSLSIRVDSSCYDDGNVEEIESWIDDNWDKISSGYNMYERVGTFSNGEAVFTKK